jgi:raffinose/stachyose/melibiose transport system permease protein
MAVRSRRRRREIVSGYLYLAPAALFIGALIMYPLIKAAQYSLQSWDGVGIARWVGLANYTQVFTNSVERGSLVNLAILLVFYSLIPVGLSLIAVNLMRRSRQRGMGFFRVVYFLPQVIVTVVVAIVWTWLLAPSGTGTVNQLLRTGIPWLGNFNWALPTIGLVAAWLDFGLAFVLLLPGIQRIPPELFDAARVDGAGLVREFFQITVPMLRRDIAAAITITAVAALQSFTLIYQATDGGPGYVTMVPGLLIYRDAFQLGAVGSASALGIVMTVIIFVITFGVRMLIERKAALDMLSRTERIVGLAVLVLAAVVTLYPLIALVTTAFASSAGNGGLSFGGHPSLGGFSFAWQSGDFSRYMLNTAIVTVTVVLVSAVFAIMSGYAIALAKPPGAKWVLYAAVFGFMLPVEALIVPWYYELRTFGLVNTYWAMILPQVAQSIAFGTFWMYVAFRSVPPSLAESARMDGASSFALLWRILVPNVAPAVKTMAALVFLWTWNAFLLPLVMISNSSLYTVTVGLSVFEGAHFNNYSALAAGSCLAALPVVVVYLFAQRSFIKGIFAGSLVE